MYVDVGSRQWTYNCHWWMDRNASSASTSIIHSNVSNATATLQFKGDHVDLYGQVGPSCGSFLVYLDGDIDSRTFNCNSSTVHSQVLLYSADVASRGDHSLKVANLAVSEQSTLYLERAVVISSRDGSREEYVQQSHNQLPLAEPLLVHLQVLNRPFQKTPKLGLSWALRSAFPCLEYYVR